MGQETDAKIETIIISVVNRLYSKEEQIGLDFEDLKALEIICKIAKEAKTHESPINLDSAFNTPDNLLELLRAAKGTPADGQE